MSDLFVYGTLCDLDLLTVVLGRDVDVSDILNAQISDHAVYWAEGQNYPLIITQADGVAQGMFNAYHRGFKRKQNHSCSRLFSRTNAHALG